MEILKGAGVRLNIRYARDGTEYGIGLRPNGDNTIPIWFSRTYS